MNQEHWKHQDRPTVKKKSRRIVESFFSDKTETCLFPVATINTQGHYLEKKTSYQLISSVKQDGSAHIFPWRKFDNTAKEAPLTCPLIGCSSFNQSFGVHNWIGYTCIKQQPS